jgi:3-deoxy-7-phosphoheptulonate synthase|tara:strand:- start:18612 stop:19625 length:1014 start_codon:yes stop_codon:yes gene_type:complete
MIIVLKPKTKKKEIESLIEKIKKKGLKPVAFEGEERTAIHVLGDTKGEIGNGWSSIQCVEKVMRILKPYKLASKEHNSQKTVVRVGDATIGGNDFVVIAGPCSVENEKQIMESARLMKDNGIKIMRASAFKPRTSPYSFQGMGIGGLKLLKKVREKIGILVETEIMDVRDVAIAAEHVDLLRIGARNMQNFDLLKEVGKVNKPVTLKRGIAATIKEFLMAAEYILMNGNKNVILCERGIRTFETAYRNTLDLAAVAILKKESHLPVIVDPSHAAGNRDLIAPLCKASAAVGADGLLIEVHPNPEEALSDGAQSLYPEQLTSLLKELKPICNAVGRKL